MTHFTTAAFNFAGAYDATEVGRLGRNFLRNTAFWFAAFTFAAWAVAAVWRFA